MEESKSKIGQNCKLFTQFLKQMKKNFNDHNKLQKQRGYLPTTDTPIFMSHATFQKQYVISYVRPYDNKIDEICFNEFPDVINPGIFKHGIFIISGKNRSCARLNFIIYIDCLLVEFIFSCHTDCPGSIGIMWAFCACFEKELILFRKNPAESKKEDTFLKNNFKVIMTSLNLIFQYSLV